MSPYCFINILGLLYITVQIYCRTSETLASPTTMLLFLQAALVQVSIAQQNNFKGGDFSSQLGRELGLFIFLKLAYNKRDICMPH